MKKITTKKTFLLQENYCDDCDNVLNAVVDEDEFWKFKVGRIRCSCGCVVLPCNECFGSEFHDRCGDCPWKNAKIKNAMTDLQYIKWCKKNEKELFELFLKGDEGEYMQSLAKKVSKTH